MTIKRHRLIKEREKLGLNQTELALKLDLTKQGYNLIENNQRDPSWKVAQRLEQFFGIPASELLAEINSAKKRVTFFAHS